MQITHNQNEISGWVLLNKQTPATQKTTSVGEDVEKLEPLRSAGGNENGAATVKNSMVAPPKIKHRIAT